MRGVQIEKNPYFGRRDRLDGSYDETGEGFDWGSHLRKSDPLRQPATRRLPHCHRFRLAGS